jgi:hypothetical protein
VWCSAGVSPWSTIKYSRFHIYADDFQFYHSSSVLDLQRCYDEINMDLQQIHEWATANGLKLNPESWLCFEWETYGYSRMYTFYEGVSADLLDSAFFKASHCKYFV